MEEEPPTASRRGLRAPTGDRRKGIGDRSRISVAGQQGLEPRQNRWGHVAPKSAPLVGPTSPDDQRPGRGVDLGVGLIGVIIGQLQTGLTGFHHHPHVAGAVGSQPHGEVLVRLGIALGASQHEHPAEDRDRVLGQFGLG